VGEPLIAEKVHEFSAPGITVQFRPGRCIHSAECVRGLPVVFQPGERPWVHPDRAPADAVAQVIHRCPTGALSYERTDGGAPEPIPARNTAVLVPDGPIHLRGRIQVVTMGGDVALEGNRMALCRCGASRRKPLCDGSHRKVGFRDPGELPYVETPVAEAGQVLQVVMSPRGPLMFRGPVTVVSGSGVARTEGGSRAFCRCGGSSNKPYCDGTHGRIGFTG
jgi:CDGSH-type Zn-finger protein/uncharacterized Fe-S cluster protein YjdI